MAKAGICIFCFGRSDYMLHDAKRNKWACLSCLDDRYVTYANECRGKLMSVDDWFEREVDNRIQ